MVGLTASVEHREVERQRDAGVGALLVLDMSYTLEMFRQRQLQQALESRQLGGFFSNVISVHPLAGLFQPGIDRFGLPDISTVNSAHLFVEGKIGRWARLSKWPRVNFVLAQISLIRLLLTVARKQHVSVVRVGDPYYLGVLGWIIARRLGVPLAVRVPFRFDEIRKITGQATMPRLLKYEWVEKRLERFIFPRCDLIAGANEDNMRYAIENGGRPEVATVFRYGNLLHPSHWVDPGERPSADLDLQDLGLNGKTFVVTVARLEPMKCVEDVIKVIAELVRRGHDVSALIIGDGTLKESLTREAQSLGVEGRMIFAGYREQESIARIIPRAVAVLSPHMGRALAEAALAAAPLVAYDYDWQREVVIDGETGFLVRYRNWEQMADRTEQILIDRRRAQKLGESARAKVARMMDPDILMRHEQSVYADLLNRWNQSHERR
jgi:glycosyltransferase involved in cell wall biosynthesis